MSLAIFFTGLINIWAEFYQHNIRTVAGCTLLILLGIVFAGAYMIPDEGNYEMFYEASKHFTGDTDPMAALYFHYNTDLGYTLTNHIFYTWGFEYWQYKLIIVVLSLSLIYFIIRRLTLSVGLVLFLYYLYPFYFDIPQIRNFIVEVILLIALAIYKNNLSGRLISFCLILLAVTFHKIALAYLVIWMVLLLREYSVGRKILQLMLFVGGAMPLYAGSIIGSLGDISFFLTSMDSFAQYAGYANTEMRMGFLIPYFHVVSLMAVVWYIKRNFVPQNNRQRCFIQILFASYLGMILLLPLMAIHGDFNRIPRNLLLPTYIAVAMYLQQITVKYQKLKILIPFLVLMYVITYFEFYYLPSLAMLPHAVMMNNFILEGMIKLFN